MTPQVFPPSPPAVSAKIIVVFSLVSRAGQLGTHNEEGGRGREGLPAADIISCLLALQKTLFPPFMKWAGQPLSPCTRKEIFSSFLPAEKLSPLLSRHWEGTGFCQGGGGKRDFISRRGIYLYQPQ